MKSIFLTASAMALALWAAPATAQNHDHGAHGDHDSTQPAPPATPTEAPPESPDHAGHAGHGAPPPRDEMPSNARQWRYYNNCMYMDDNGDPIMINCVRLAVFTDGSGTARQPGRDGGHMHGNIVNGAYGGWNIGAHGFVSLQGTSHGGPRGGDKAYVTSMAMLMAERDTGWGNVQLRAMGSLEPLMDNRGYPNLFATGETADGVPLVDRQHPHDLFMELSARVDVDLSEHASIFAYGGPVGEPALGPSVFMHRASAAGNPEPPITHHWFDSTHITYGVATVGLATRQFQLETSLFTGREPDERRWNIEKPRLDSWSVRATVTPNAAWAWQASYGKLKEPEFLTHPGEDEKRFTTSLAYSGQAFGGDRIAAMAAFSAKKRDGGRTLTAWLAEATWRIDDAHSLFGRFENVRNDELFPDHHDPRHEVPFRVNKFQLGYAWRTALDDNDTIWLTLGGSANAYAKPAALDPVYGKSPLGGTLFARFSIGH